MGMMLVKNFPNRLFAEMAQRDLEEEGIHSVLKAPDYGITGSGSGGSMDLFSGQGVDLYVEEEDAAKAEEIVRTRYDGI